MVFTAIQEPQSQKMASSAGQSDGGQNSITQQPVHKLGGTTCNMLTCVTLDPKDDLFLVIIWIFTFADLAHPESCFISFISYTCVDKYTSFSRRGKFWPNFGQKYEIFREFFEIFRKFFGIFRHFFENYWKDI